MSIETTLARADARAAEDRWQAHRRDCPVCVTAQRKRKPAVMCGQGSGLYRDRGATARELERQRELDKQPIPGQGALFG